MYEKKRMSTLGEVTSLHIHSPSSKLSKHKSYLKLNDGTRSYQNYSGLQSHFQEQFVPKQVKRVESVQKFLGSPDKNETTFKMTYGMEHANSQSKIGLTPTKSSFETLPSMPIYPKSTLDLTMKNKDYDYWTTQTAQDLQRGMNNHSDVHQFMKQWQ